MKNQAFVVFLFLSFFISNTINAQVSVGPSVSFGWGNGDGETGGSRTIEATVNVPFRNNYFIHTGVGLNRQKLGFDLFSEQGNTWEVRTFEIPLAMGVDAKVSERIGFYLYGGALFGAVYKNESYYFDDRMVPILNGEDFNDYKVGLLLGTGIRIKNEKVIWWLGIQNKRGLNDLTVNSDKHNLTINSTDILRIGMMVPILKK